MSAKGQSLGGQWNLASKWYAARPKREKLILLGAALALVWALADALLLTPAMRSLKTSEAQLKQKESELVQLDSQRIALAESVRAREAQLKQETEATRAGLAEATSRLADLEKTMVPARQMATFLRSLLPAAGVEIVALKTLAPTPLIVRAAGKADEKKEGEIKDMAPVVREPAANIYRHGLEITLAGNYDALLAYLTRIENSPQKVLWGRLELKVDKHPRNEITLVLYTLSLDPSWLVV
jgi:MSHA biogenesis protein MshJ